MTGGAVGKWTFSGTEESRGDVDAGFIKRFLPYRLVQDIESADVSSLCPEEPGGLYGLGKYGWSGWKGLESSPFWTYFKTCFPEDMAAFLSLGIHFLALSPKAPSHITPHFCHPKPISSPLFVPLLSLQNTQWCLKFQWLQLHMWSCRVPRAQPGHPACGASPAAWLHSPAGRRG